MPCYCSKAARHSFVGTAGQYHSLCSACRTVFTRAYSRLSIARAFSAAEVFSFGARGMTDDY